MDKQITIKDILSFISDIQQNTAPVVLSIGNVNKEGFVEHNQIVIKECCSSVLYRLIEEYSHKDNIFISVVDNGLIIDI
jgi:hypothetical protein